MSSILLWLWTWNSISSESSTLLCSVSQRQKADMASTTAIPPPSFSFCGKETLLRNHGKSSIFSFGERQRCLRIVSKAVGENSDSSTSLSIVKSVKSAWDKSEDRIALFGLGFSAVVAVWASSNLIGAIDKLPFIPTIFEIIGILFSWWFVYRWLLFKPDREELVKTIKSSVSEILGQ